MDQNRGIREWIRLELAKHHAGVLGYPCYFSEKYRYVYISIPKNASTKIKTDLHEMEGLSSVPACDLHARAGYGLDYVPSLSLYSHDDIEAALTSPDYFRFAFVRNPYHRVFSAYKDKILRDTESSNFLDLRYLIRTTRSRYPVIDGLPTGNITFRDFVFHILEARPQNPHWSLQTEVLCYDHMNYNYVGKVENFDSDYRFVLGKIGAPQFCFDRLGDRINNTPQIELSAVYCHETAAIVYELYRETFEILGYHRDSWLRE